MSMYCFSHTPHNENKIKISHAFLTSAHLHMHPMAASVVLLIFLSWALVASANQKEINLNGDDWLLSDEAGRVKGIQATVPGIVHMDLLYAKHTPNLSIIALQRNIIV